MRELDTTPTIVVLHRSGSVCILANRETSAGNREFRAPSTANNIGSTGA